MKLFNKQKREDVSLPAVQTVSRSSLFPFSELERYTPLMNGETRMYAALREAVPVVDAALDKIVRLVGSFSVECKNKNVEKRINDFLRNVKAGGCLIGIDSFLNVYLNQLLTYGTAVGEIVLTGDGKSIYSLLNVPLKKVEFAFDKNGIDTLIYICDGIGQRKLLPFQQLMLVSALNPQPGKLCGESVLKGLPFVSSILLKIFNSIGSNWERVGNVRFAVTYRPTGDGDRAMSKQRAAAIAEEWSKAMRDTQKVSDFVSVGDVSVKVIGADNQILDSEVPVRQMLEQIVAKLSIPPFLLGLNWSTTERMSSQQADILTSELEYFRRLLEGAVRRICDMWLRLEGVEESYQIVWNNINLQDETELASARLNRAQAMKIEQELEADNFE
ncbi:MAG: serine/threonine protein phosphatase [Clostridia bacterium]|nr:serine/threonine protein phosphatase [Clostridia bacterium]